MPTPTKKKTTTTAAKDETTKRGPTKVNYPAKAVTEMAEAVKPTSGNRARYMNLMQPLTEQPGQLFLLAEYQAETGANRVKNQIQKGNTDVPGGAEAWELTAVKTTVQDADGNDTIGSHLYVKYIGEAEEDAEE